MRWLAYLTLGLLFLVALVTGGAAVRLAAAAGDPRTAVTVGLLVVLLVGAVVRGVGSRSALRNPYW